MYVFLECKDVGFSLTLLVTCTVVPRSMNSSLLGVKFFRLPFRVTELGIPCSMNSSSLLSFLVFAIPSFLRCVFLLSFPRLDQSFAPLSSFSVLCPQQSTKSQFTVILRSSVFLMLESSMFRFQHNLCSWAHLQFRSVFL